ncbi:MAG: ORF6N domain-containing protein [Verrucomicrobiota bacterium]
MKKSQPVTISPEVIAPLVHWLRHEKVMLDSDLAELYGVTTGRLNEAVKRNLDRFPADFMFQPTEDEMEILISQIAISSSAPFALKFQSGRSKAHGGRRHLPYAFTEQGVAMLSSVLRSQRAVEVNIAIMRTFVQLRRLMDSNRDLAQKIGEMEAKYDGQFRIVFDAIRRLITPPAQPSRELGFHTIPPKNPAKKAPRRKL